MNPYSAILLSVLFGFIVAVVIGFFVNPFWGVLSAIVIAVIRESLDIFESNAPDALGLIAMIVGGLTAFIIFQAFIVL